ncbi:MAG TPA: ATP-binding protein [Usitatibacter sp.]|jgi:two-component sensor histidine kinase/branched-subunit amino acid transport protein AzlD|nr:ATP-binding protein [Usitatibacter sp.]
MSAVPPSFNDRITRAVIGARRWVVLAMLLSLHLALVSEPEGTFQRIWLLVHFGLFLLWQPFFAAERELEIFSAVLLFAITAVTLYYVSGWLIVGWLILLMGVLGGRVFTVRAALQSRFYLVAFTYVVTMLLLWAVPVLILGERQLPEHVGQFARWALPFLLALLAVLPFGGQDQDASQVFDFFYAVLVFQLGIVLVLGSIALMRFTNENYIASVTLTVMGFGIALFVFAVLWNPSRGFGGLRTYLSRYLLSVGMPFELWMRRVAELAETESDSQRFLEAALREISTLPWIRGGTWKSADGEGEFGRPGEHSLRFEQHGLTIVFNAEIPLSPALFLHMRLLAQVVGEFHEGKRREIVLRQNAYLQAVHEAGARLTHDVKNLLQSIYALTSMAPRDSSDGYATLLQRQLPQLSKRLESTIEKLRSPEVAGTELSVAAHAWWNDLRRRLEGSGVAFTGEVGPGRLIPTTLFDSFVENALENARAKAASEPAIAISISFDASPDGTVLSVSDTGSAVPATIARRLFGQPVERDNGLGIGLFHTARLARQSGYELELLVNRDGCVCFALSGNAGVG